MSKNLVKLFFLSLSVILVHVSAVNAFDALSDPFLVGWWGFDEGAGTLAADGSGNGNDGSLQGDALWVPGVHGEGLSLNGNNAYVSTENSLLNDLTGFTLAGWVNAVNTNSYTSLFGQNDLIEFGFTTENGGGLGVWMSGNGWAYLGADYPYDYPSWHHVALTGDDTRVVIYIDGEEQASDEGGMSSGTSGFTFNIGGFVFNDNLGGLEGEVDDVWVYSRALSQEEIQALMSGAGGAERASVIYPEDDAVDVPREPVLSWNPGEFASTHNVYFGASFEDVNAADAGNPLNVINSQNQDANSFTPGRLEFGQTYYWRVDEVNGTPDKTVYRGNVWHFEVEPFSIPIEGSDIMVTASSSSNQESLPEKTLDGSGLGDDQTHAVASETMWFTAMGDMTPWIQYEFEGIKKLDTMKVWNSNTSVEGFIGYGVKDVLIEYSKDGESWDVFEDVNEFSRAPGARTDLLYGAVL